MVTTAAPCIGIKYLRSTKNRLAPMSEICSPVWGFPLSFIDGITSYIKGFTLSPEPSKRRGIQMLPCNPPEIVIFSSFFEVVSLHRICVTDYQRPVCRCVNLSSLNATRTFWTFYELFVTKNSMAVKP